MRNIFSYDSTLMRFLSRLFDIAVLSVMYIVCSLPVITIGAAQAGMPSGVRAISEPDGKNTPIRAFINGFLSGFWKITLVWICCAIPIGCIVYLVFGAAGTETQMQLSFVLISFLIGILIMMFQIMASMMHACFDCGLLDLIKNGWIMVVTYPLRSLIMALFAWAPLLLAFLEPYIFLACSPVFIFFYYGLFFMFCNYLLRNPFKRIRNIYFPEADH